MTVNRSANKRRLDVSAEDFMTREGAQEVLHRVIDPLKPLYSEGGARLDVGDNAAWYEVDTVPMEAFARVLWGVAAMWAGGGRDADFERLVTAGLTSGTDPNSPEYWGVCHDFDQRFVEMAAISYGLLFARERTWDPLSEAAKRNLADWLRQINCCKVVGNNWYLFRIMTNVALHRLGLDYDAARLTADLDLIDGMYDADGWYRDGATNKDYYNPYVFGTYGLAYAMVMADEDPERCARFRERAALLLRDYARWFSATGASFAYGRSLTYRFAQAGFLSACAWAGVTAPGIGLAELKGLIARNLADWLNRPIFDNGGVLTIGYGYPNLQMQEPYNAPGSPYWAMKAFLLLAMPADHPFWKAPIAPLPQFEALDWQRAAGMLIQRSAAPAGDVTMLTAGLTHPDHSHGYEKYSKFAYSSRFGFSIARSNLTLEEFAPDSMLAVRVDGRLYGKESAAVDDSGRPEISMDGTGYSVVWSPCPGVQVSTRVKATADGHERVHEIKAERACEVWDCGFAVNASDAETSARNGVSDGSDGRCVAWAECDGARCEAEDLTEGKAGEAVVIRPDPNTNLIVPKTVIPAIHHTIPAGTTVIRTAVRYL